KGDVNQLVRCMARVPGQLKGPRGQGPAALVEFAQRTVQEALNTATADVREAFQPGAERITDGASAVRGFTRRLETAGKRHPELLCLNEFIRPTLQTLAGQVDALVKAAQPALDAAFREVIEPKIQELVKNGVVQGIGVITGPAAEQIIAARVIQYMYDLKRLREGVARIGALASAVGSGQGVDAAYAQIQ